MENWKVKLTAGQTLTEEKIQRSIFQEVSLSPQIFVIATMSLNYITKKCTGGYKLKKSQEKINPRMYMADIKVLAKNEKELETMRIYSQYIGMELGIKKYASRIMEKAKRETTDGIELPNQEIIRTLGKKENYLYLGISEADTIKQIEMKGKNTSEQR